MNIVILGAYGQLGRDLTSILSADKQLNIIALSREQLNAQLNQHDLNQILLGYNPQILINCIAATHVDNCEVDSALAWQVNSDFVYRLVQFCRLTQSVELIHISTDYVFDGLKNTPYIETDKAQPLNVYGLSKYAAELIISAYLSKFFIFRVAGLFGRFGAQAKGGNFITTMQKLAQEKDQFGVVADQMSNPTSTMAVARCIHFFIAHKVSDYGTYHCVSANACSWYDFACKILELSALDVNKVKKLDYNSYPFKAHRPQNSTLAINKLEQYYVMPTWQESLQEYMKLTAQKELDD